MRFSTIPRWVMRAVFGLGMLTGGVAIMRSPLTVAQEAKGQETKAEEVKTEELSRKPKTKVSPIYPDMARRMSIAGTVKLAVVVSPNGTVKSSKPVGGHPLLVNAAMDAMKQWKFEPGPTETSGVVEFKFQPRN